MSRLLLHKQLLLNRRLILQPALPGPEARPALMDIAPPADKDSGADALTKLMENAAAGPKRRRLAQKQNDASAKGASSGACKGNATAKSHAQAKGKAMTKAAPKHKADDKRAKTN